MDEETKALLRSILADNPSASYTPHQAYGMEAIQLTGMGGKSITFFATSPDYGDWTIETNHGEIDRSMLGSKGERYDARGGGFVRVDVEEV